LAWILRMAHLSKGREKLQTLFAMDGYLANCIVQGLLKKIAAQATN